MRQRWDIVSDLINQNNYKVIAEIGVSRGINASEIFKRCPKISKFYLIDQNLDVFDWGLFDNYGKDKLRVCTEDTITFSVSGALYVTCNSSVKIASDLKQTFDLIFIDADHSYDAVKQDIEVWYPKLKKGGIICGHDYIDYIEYGVKQAVDEIFPKANLEADVLENGNLKIWWVKNAK